MRQRSLLGALLLLLGGLLAVPEQVPGQGAPAWAPSGAPATSQPPPSGSRVIASTRAPLLPSMDGPLRPPDDGLVPLAPLDRVAAPPPTGPKPPLQQATYVPEPAKGPPPPKKTKALPPPAPIKAPPPDVVPPAPTAARSGSEGMLSLEVFGPAEAHPGQAMSCTIVVRNAGATAIAGAHVEAPLAPGVRVLSSNPPAQVVGDLFSWQLGNLEVGAVRRLEIVLRPADAGEVVLRPVGAFGIEGLRARVVRPPFGATVTAPETANAGGRLLFQVQLVNNRDVPAQKVVLRALLSAGLQHPQGKEVEAELTGLAPGEARLVSLEVSAIAPGRQVNAVTATAFYPDGEQKAQAQAVVQVVQRSLALKLDGPRTGAIQGEIDVRLEVECPREASAPDVRVGQYVPDGLDFVSASSGGAFNPSNRVISWALGSFAPAQRQTVTFKVRGRSPGDWGLPAAAAAVGMAEARATHAVHLDAVPQLALELLNPAEGPIDVKGEAVYELRVSNPGTVVATGLTLVVSLPDGLEAVGGNGPTAARVVPRQIAFDPLAELAPNRDAVYKVRVRGLTAGPGRFRALLQANGLPQALAQEVTVQVRATGSSTANSGQRPLLR